MDELMQVAMAELGLYDVRSRVPRAPAWAVEGGIVVTLVAMATLGRWLIGLEWAGVVAFPLVFPAIAAATVLAGARAGLLVLIGCQILAWYLFVPAHGSFAFARAGDAVSLAMATAAQLLLLGFVTAHRRSASLLRSQSEALEHTVSVMKRQADLNAQIGARDDALRETRRNLEAIYQSSADGLTLCEAAFGPDGRVTEYQVLEVNRAHAELTGVSRERMLNQPVSAIAPPIDPRWIETADAVLKTGVMQHFDVRSPLTGRWLNIRVSRVSEKLFQQTFVDISDRYTIEEQRRALLKEMSHRVMNNFQMIEGFLHLQAASAGAETRAQLETAERRVHVLASLHSLLAYTESDAEIDAAAYVEQLCSYLTSMIERPEAVVLVCEAGPMHLAADKVVLLGFIISELVTNSAKYAYPAPHSGVIRVSLQPDAQGWTLSVGDEGQGLTTTAPKPHSLGSRLVQRFTAQLGAEMTTTTGPGVRHEIVFRHGEQV